MRVGWNPWVPRHVVHECLHVDAFDPRRGALEPPSAPPERAVSVVCVLVVGGILTWMSLGKAGGMTIPCEGRMALGSVLALEKDVVRRDEKDIVQVVLSLAAVRMPVRIV